LARREAFAREMGGVDKVKRQHDQGRLTVRERIDKLTDRGSFHEIGAVSGTGEYDSSGELQKLTPANCVFGSGRASTAARWLWSATTSPCVAARRMRRSRPSR
ncbi:hypothetical protein KEM07_28350, partial [Pseudomonas carnis]|uniref:hypothetical protein n=1 Tax=Pseudomonas carnis TaxID=2487355 RepID=UPI001C306CB1